jgi:hypothetical protein
MSLGNSSAPCGALVGYCDCWAAPECGWCPVSMVCLPVADSSCGACFESVTVTNAACFDFEHSFAIIAAAVLGMLPIVGWLALAWASSKRGGCRVCDLRFTRILSASGRLDEALGMYQGYPNIPPLCACGSQAGKGREHLLGAPEPSPPFATYLQLQAAIVAYCNSQCAAASLILWLLSLAGTVCALQVGGAIGALPVLCMSASAGFRTAMLLQAWSPDLPVMRATKLNAIANLFSIGAFGSALAGGGLLGGGGFCAPINETVAVLFGSLIPVGYWGATQVELLSFGKGAVVFGRLRTIHLTATVDDENENEAEDDDPKRLLISLQGHTAEAEEDTASRLSSITSVLSAVGSSWVFVMDWLEPDELLVLCWSTGAPISPDEAATLAARGSARRVSAMLHGFDSVGVDIPQALRDEWMRSGELPHPEHHLVHSEAVENITAVGSRALPSKALRHYALSTMRQRSSNGEGLVALSSTTVVDSAEAAP